MPEEVEVETHELQETIDELHEERREREESERRNAWTRYIALTTALLAVFAAIGAMQSGALVNEAMIQQIKAADKWNEYQAARLKDHTYAIAANNLVDSGALPPAAHESDAGEQPKPHGKKAPKPAEGAAKPEKKGLVLKKLGADERLADYAKQIGRQQEKETDLSTEAKKLEGEAAELMHHHHRFAMAVAFIQVAIALSAVAALARMKPVWAGSIVIGLLGVTYFLMGFLAH
jgi:hypothetical protein